MSLVEIQTPLSLDRGCVNLLAYGRPVQVLITDGNSYSSGTDDDGSQEGGYSRPDTPKHELITASAKRLITGANLSAFVCVEAAESGGHRVTFDPSQREKGDYTLEVCYKGEHIQGSPYFLRFVEPLALSSVHTERRRAVMDADKPINFIVPLEARGEVGVTVEGPFGTCKADINQVSLDEDEEIVSVQFMPKGTGAYSIHITVDQEQVKSSPFLFLADYSGEEARKCYVLPEEQHLFKKLLRFRGNGHCISFHVNTERALQSSRRAGELSMLCSGPGKASIRLSRDTERTGLEKCEMVLSVAGDYQLSLLWDEQHISGSPCVFRLRKTRSKIVASGLNLGKQVYHVSVPYQFKLNCSDFKGGAPDITCEPATACDITITALTGGGSESAYKCELVPLEAGTHTVSVKFSGREILGSPFCVQFEDSCKPEACKIVEGSRTYMTGGTLSLKVNTQDAGPGTLAAIAEDLDSHTTLPVTTTQLSADNIYQVEFNPGQSVKCNLGVTFNKHHIPGSPFKLMFANPEKFTLKGKGLIGGHVGVWNTFTVQVADSPLGELSVEMARNDGVNAETIITSVDTHNFEVKFLPNFPGKYTVNVKLGHIPIPGSPFHVNCTSAVFRVKKLPEKATVGSPMEFEVHLVSGSLLEGNNDLKVIMKPLKQGGESRGQETLVEREGQQMYTCTLTPKNPGHHLVGIKWNMLNIEGSPFSVKVVAEPKPENVCVYGAGVEGGEMGKDVEFTIEVGRAGGGQMTVNIRGPTKDLEFKSRPDPHNKRILHTQYCPSIPGHYSIQVKWAGTHVPGSPFKADFLPPTTTCMHPEITTAEVHPEATTCTAEVHPEATTADVQVLGHHS